MSRLSPAGTLSRLASLLGIFLICAQFPSFSRRVANTLSPTGSMRNPRASHTASLLPDGSVLIAGGFAGSGFESRPYVSTELFDPASGAFHLGPDMSVPRSGHAAVTLKDNRILLVGGWSGASGVTNSAEIYDPATQRFSPVGSMAVARGECTATLLPDGKVLVTGGVDPNQRALSSAEIFNPDSNSFSAAPSMLFPRSQHTATLLGDGTVLINGGGSCDCPSKTVYRAAELYEPSVGKFLPVGNPSAARYKHSALLLADGRVLVAGGSDARDWRGLLASAELYDPPSRSFQSLPPMSIPRFKFPQAAVRLQSGDVLIAGGAPSAELYRAKQRAFGSVTGGFDAARYFASSTLLRDGRVLVVGGYSPAAGGLPATSRAWLYRP
jgi:Kelch motif